MTHSHILFDHSKNNAHWWKYLCWCMGVRLWSQFFFVATSVCSDFNSQQAQSCRNAVLIPASPRSALTDKVLIARKMISCLYGNVDVPIHCWQSLHWVDWHNPDDRWQHRGIHHPNLPTVEGTNNILSIWVLKNGFVVSLVTCLKCITHFKRGVFCCHNTFRSSMGTSILHVMWRKHYDWSSLKKIVLLD